MRAPSTNTPSISTLQLIWFAQLAAIGTYGLVLHISHPFLPAPSGEWSRFSAALQWLAIIPIIVAWVWHRRTISAVQAVLDHAPTPEQREAAKNTMSTASIISMTLLEIPAVYGLLLCFTGVSTSKTFYELATPSAIGLLIYRVRGLSTIFAAWNRLDPPSGALPHA